MRWHRPCLTLMLQKSRAWSLLVSVHLCIESVIISNRIQSRWNVCSPSIEVSSPNEILPDDLVTDTNPLWELPVSVMLVSGDDVLLKSRRILSVSSRLWHARQYWSAVCKFHQINRAIGDFLNFESSPNTFKEKTSHPYRAEPDPQRELCWSVMTTFSLSMLMCKRLVWSCSSWHSSSMPFSIASNRSSVQIQLKEHRSHRTTMTKTLLVSFVWNLLIRNLNRKPTELSDLWFFLSILFVCFSCFSFEEIQKCFFHPHECFGDEMFKSSKHEWT